MELEDSVLCPTDSLGRRTAVVPRVREVLALESGCLVSLILPAHNEEAVIVQAIAEATVAFAHLGVSGEILVVDDGSKDRTADLVRELAKDNPTLRLLSHEVNRGYGAALRSGFEAARGELVAFTDADCQFHLEDLNRLLPLVQAGPGTEPIHDIVTGWREDRKDPPLRLFLSRGFNLLVDGILGIGVRDVDCALKVFRRESLGRILPENKGFFANTEMFVRARQEGLSIAEVGVRHRPRAAGSSKVNLLAIPRVLNRLLPFWWTRVLHSQAAVEKEPFWSWNGAGVLGLLVGLGLMIFGMGSNAPLMEPTEARNAEVARAMLESESYVVPVLDGEAYLDKPPLLYWSLMGLFGPLGGTDRVARILPTLWCTASVVLVWWWLRREAGGKAALFGGLSLLFLIPFVHYGRLLTMDGLLGMWLLAAWVAVFGAVRTRRISRIAWVSAGISLGMAGLAKGPVAFVLFGLMAGPLVLWDERLRKPGFSGWLGLSVLGLSPLAFWSFLVERAHPGFISDFLFTHHLVRFADPIDHAEPFWFYLPYVTLLAFPWSLGAVGAMVIYFRSPRARFAELPPVAGVAMLGLVAGLAFFSLAGCKRPSYLVPLFPWLAILSGVMLDRFRYRFPVFSLSRWGANWKDWKWGASELGALAWILGMGFAGTGFLRSWIPPSMALFWGTVSLAGLVWTIQGKRIQSESWGLGLAAWAVVMVWGSGWILPGYNGQFSIRGPLASLDSMTEKSSAGEKEQISAEVVLCYPQIYYSTGFYTQDATVEVYGHAERKQLIDRILKEPKAIVLVKSSRAWEELEASTPEGWRWQASSDPGQFRAARLVRNP